MEEPKHTKPLLLQSGKEMMDTVLGERATDAALASGGDWVKAISERRMPSRHQKGQGR
jgi:hypothetical protein